MTTNNEIETYVPGKYPRPTATEGRRVRNTYGFNGMSRGALPGDARVTRSCRCPEPTHDGRTAFGGVTADGWVFYCWAFRGAKERTHTFLANPPGAGPEAFAATVPHHYLSSDPIGRHRCRPCKTCGQPFDGAPHTIAPGAE